MNSNKKIPAGIVLSLSLFINACSSSIPVNVNIGIDKAIDSKNNSFSIKNLQQTFDGYNEDAYLWAYPDIREGVRNGLFQTGYQHFNPYGRNEERTKRPEYLKYLSAVVDEGFIPQVYLSAYPDINLLVEGDYEQAYIHYVNYGKSEGRLKRPVYLNAKYSLPFNEEIYLFAFPDINNAVNNNMLPSGYEHFILYGNDELRTQRQSYIDAKNIVRDQGYNESAYLLSNLDVRKSVNEKLIYRGYEHFNPHGMNEGRATTSQYIQAKQSILDGYNEEAYLMAYPDVYNAVKTGVLKTGYQHFNDAGRSERRLDRQIYKDMKREILVNGYNDDAYIAAFPDIKAAVAGGSIPTALSHFINYGKAEGRALRPEYTSIYSKMTSSPVAPTGLKKVNVTPTSATLNWNATPGANGYDIYNGNNVVAYNVTSTNYQVNGLTPGSSYVFSVYASNWHGNSAPSSIRLGALLPVNLGTAGNFVMLSKSAISTTGTTQIIGDIGLSPSARTFFTGFSETLDPSNVFATSSIVNGKMYAANMEVPTPSNLTTTVLDMQTAFTDAAGRTLPDYTELGAGDVSGMTLTPGLYKWGTGLLINSGVTLSGGPNDVWIFQIAQDLTVSNGTIITLAGGVLPKNIFWQVSGQATLGTTSDFKGILLSKTLIAMKTGAVINGRMLAQTAITLDSNAVTQPSL